MENFILLLEQLYNKSYRPLSFSIFNFIEDDGFITQLCASQKKRYDIDDFEYLKFDIDETIRNGVKYSKKDVLRSIYMFKDHVENELQNDHVQLKIYPIKESGSIIAVKLKNFTLINPEN